MSYKNLAIKTGIAWIQLMLNVAVCDTGRSPQRIQRNPWRAPVLIQVGHYLSKYLDLCPRGKAGWRKHEVWAWNEQSTLDGRHTIYTAVVWDCRFDSSLISRVSRYIVTIEPSAVGLRTLSLLCTCAGLLTQTLTEDKLDLPKIAHLDVLCRPTV